MRPRILLLLGDRNGIGPELVARLVPTPGITERAAVIIVGDEALLGEGMRIAGTRSSYDLVGAIDDIDWDRPGPFVLSFRPEVDIATTPGEVDPAAGREVLQCLAFAIDLVDQVPAAGIVFAPLNKQAMHAGGLAFADELGFIADRLGFTGHKGELNVLGDLWTTRVTSHVALRDVCDLLTTERIVAAIRLADRSVRAAGVDVPRIGVAALNPHAGDGGNFGREEIDIIAPAVAEARSQGLEADGPHAGDTVFVKARRGEFDAVVTMYHDQGQIAMKLLGFGQGVTVLGGLPVPIATCGHGTAYDIVGQGQAVPDGLRHAFEICCRMARRPASSNATPTSPRATEKGEGR